MPDDLNKLDLFIKIMRLTVNDNDSQALVAIKKANAMLSAEGWDWDKLLRNKVKIITNPFANGFAAPRAATPAPMRPSPAPKASPPPQPAAANPWPSGKKPQPAASAWPAAGMQTPPRHTPPPPTAQPGPFHFRRRTGGKQDYGIAYHRPLTGGELGSQVNISKRDGSIASETIGPFIERLPSGHYLYEIAKASKWKRKHAGATTAAPTLDDIL